MTTTETNVRPGDILRATNLPSYAKLVKVGDILLVCREDEVAVDAKPQPKLVLAASAAVVYEGGGGTGASRAPSPETATTPQPSIASP